MISYFSIAAAFYVGAIVWQSKQREGLYVFHLFLFFLVGALWPAFVFVGGFVWLVESDFMNIRIRW